MKEWLLSHQETLIEVLFNKSTWLAVLDILLVYALIYWGLLLLRGTKSVRTLFGLLLLTIVYTTVRLMGLQTITWIFEQFFSSFILVILILFQDEIRRALSRLGISVFNQNRLSDEAKGGLNNIVKAVSSLSTSKIGALIVLERDADVKDFIQEGTQINSEIVEELLYSIFLPYSPLHDGAVLVRDNKLVSAGVFLPLAKNPNIAKSLGTRHRAAIGLTEQTDALVIVVSETDGKISLCSDGEINRGLDVASLNNQLLALLDPQGTPLPVPKTSTGARSRRSSNPGRRKTSSFPTFTKNASGEHPAVPPEDND